MSSAVCEVTKDQRVAAAGAPTFLETESPQNVRYYSKMRFEVVESGDDHVLRIPVWRMVCRPDRVVLPRHGPHSASSGDPLA